MKRPNAGGGWPAIFYVFRKARQAGGVLRLYRELRTRNACKTCALGMGGQLGGMVNEKRRFPEVCKKSVQAMAADMTGAVHDHFFNDFSIQRMRGMSSRELEAAGRLTQPLYAGPLDNHYTTIDWDEALERIAGKLKQTGPDNSFFYFSGRSSNEAGFLLQLFARLYGTNNVNNCSFYCHQASGVGLSSVTGSGTATIVLDDLDKSDLVFVIGANPASNHPRLMTTLMELKRRGGKVIVVNPLKETGLVRFKVPSSVRSMLFGTTIADHYIQPNIGGDIAFFTGLAKAVLERDAVDETFVNQYAEGWDEFRDRIENTSWDEIVTAGGVPRRLIEQVADVYAKSTSTIFSWAMGVTHHKHGVENVQMIANVAMMRGMLGSPGRGLLPIRGHSNVQGMGSVGVTPKLKDAIFERLQSEFNVQLPTQKGLDTLGCMHAAANNTINFAMCLGGNLFGSNPDADFARRAFQNIDMVTYLSTTLNTGHAHGVGRETIILPVLARDEEPQPTTQESMFNYVRLSDGGIKRYDGPRAEVEVIADMAQRVLDQNTPIDWKSMRQHGRIREAIGRIIPGYEAIGEIDRTRNEFHIDGRTFHKPTFNTDNGRAKFHAVSIPQHTTPDHGQLRLMTVRSEGQFNTVVYEEQDMYRGQDRRDVVMMSRDDMARLGLRVDQRVKVASDCGALSNVLVRETDIPPGNAAMYYPEANVLVPKVADEQSKTPAFKHTLVTISALSPAS